MSGLNYLANALLIDSVDEVRNEMLNAYSYAAVHRLRIDPNIDSDFKFNMQKAFGSIGRNDGLH